MDGLTASDWGILGAIESEAKRIWKEHRIDAYADLVSKAAKKIDRATSRGIGHNPKGGRPNKHSEKLYRSDRPKNEVLMPHDADAWPVRERVSY